MKIIAKTSSEGYGQRFLVEMTENEVAKLAGSPYASSLPSDQKPKIGSEYDVDQAWEDLHAFRAANAKIKSAAETLRARAQLSITASAAYVITPPEQPAEPPAQ